MVAGTWDEFKDPRTLLAYWANAADEWARLLVAEVIATGRPVSSTTIQNAYKLFRQEKSLDRRELPTVAKIDIEARQDESAPPLTLIRLSEVHGVNALVPGSIIEPHEGLTILYGENGTGKTGYSRIFKALANSRTADTILGNVDGESPEEQSARLEFKLGDSEQTLSWTGSRGVSPFTRMSIFDSPAVTTHVDDELEYVYVPASLALFNHVTAAIQAVAGQIDAAIEGLGTTSATGLLARFQRGSSIYPLIESLGASTDLASLKARASSHENANTQIEELTQTVSALRSNTLGTQISALRADLRVLVQAAAVADAVLRFDATTYNRALERRSQLAADYETFRSGLFAAADLPAPPEDSWNGFIVAGDTYRRHLADLGVHDPNRCLYCRQDVSESARALISRYSAYLEYKISTDLRETDAALSMQKRQIAGIESNEVAAFMERYREEEERPTYFPQVEVIEKVRSVLSTAVTLGAAANLAMSTEVTGPRNDITAAIEAIGIDISTRETQQQNRSQVLGEKQTELLELKDAVELNKSWHLIESLVTRAKEADRLRILKRPLPSLMRAVTEMAKTASDQLINQSFDALFLEECEALRAPALKLQFAGREGKAQRRKVMSGKHKPSKVLSEGEQKVLALADFLAEARLAGITAPVIFDDPVSSLDHRRVNEVAHRIAKLADDIQVIVFTHDILFATTLLGLFEKSKRCAHFQVTDENGKGQVLRATGPRIDSLGAIKGRINSTIQAAHAQQGEAREALVHTGYSHLRSWCEVFVEEEVLKGVTKRYRANVQMTTLPEINIGKLGEIVPKVTEIFEIACRHVDAHSQPLVTLGVSPTLTGLETHWADLQDLRKLNDSKAER